MNDLYVPPEQYCLAPCAVACPDIEKRAAGCALGAMIAVEPTRRVEAAGITMQGVREVGRTCMHGTGDVEARALKEFAHPLPQGYIFDLPPE